jgi:hypothetical protein
MVMVIVIVTGIFVMIGLMFSKAGHEYRTQMLDQAYAADPDDPDTADAFLNWAWFQAHIMWEDKRAMDMYREFLAVLPDEGGTDFYDTYNKYGRYRWTGKWDAKKKKGWGISHPRACEAFYSYLKLYESNHSKQRTAIEARKYYKLFYELYGMMRRDGRPHPKFYVYWQRIVDRYIKPGRMGRIPRPAPRPAAMSGPEELE